ncbi:PIN domain-containing protein [Gordonia westfalica]|uniref:PIN domain-containing protein n=1 Tax=Gordonia westfalica TaxID=158898 RepID=A0A1H2IUY4_9ACTN|nr:PIN domain-containing protein [Gordonia westfalica]
MAGFRVVLDACVLVPINRVDPLLTFAEQRAYFPLWSDRIMDETVRGIHRATKGRVSEERARTRVDAMNNAFEDACVEGWEPLEAAIAGMPDPDDRHVVAAAVRGHATTSNTSRSPSWSHWGSTRAAVTGSSWTYSTATLHGRWPA